MPLPTSRTLAIALTFGSALLASPLTAAAADDAAPTQPGANAMQQPAPAPAPAQPAPVAPMQPAPAPGPVLAPTGPTPDAATQPQPQQPAPDAADEGEKRRPGAAWVPWRGSAFNWSNDVTTTAVGIGNDNISNDAEVYSMGFGLTLNYFIVDTRDFRLRLTSSLGFDVELTDGGTTTKNEPIFRDIPLTIATGGLTVAHSEDGMWAFGFIPNFTGIFPTSPISQDRGIYFTTSPRLLTFFNFPILGAESEHLQSIFSGVSVRWDKTFSRATTPTNNSLAVPRKDPSGSTFFSDQISGNRLGDNTLRVGGFLFLEEKFGPVTLWFSGGPSWRVTFLDEYETVDCVQIDTGCVAVEPDPNAPSTRVDAGFGASVSIFPMSEWGLDLGYSNNTLQLGEDGKRRNIFYSPDATFSATLIISVDAIYEGIVGPRREAPVVIFGKNAPQQPGAQQPGTQPGAPSMPGLPGFQSNVF